MGPTTFRYVYTSPTHCRVQLRIGIASPAHFVRATTQADHSCLQQQQIIHDLQENLDQMTRDKITLEAKIIEMSPYKSEMVVLQGEITKLQVRNTLAANAFAFAR